MASLLSYGDMEAGAGAPWVPTNWASVDLDAGDTEAEATIIHAGAQSMQWNVGASGEGIRQQITAAVGAFVRVSLWSYGDGSAGFTIGGLDATQMVLQSSTTLFNVATPHTAVWTCTRAVFRVVAANPYLYILADAGAAGERFTDDVSCFVDTAITLTVTPASAANSVELTTGIRVDGYDRLEATIPTGYLAATGGWLRAYATLRHGDATAYGFNNGQSPTILDARNGAQYIQVYYSAAGTLTLAYTDGTGPQAGNWAAGGALLPNTAHLFEVRYTPGQMWLDVDGVTRITITAAVNFTLVPSTAGYGHRVGGGYNGDMVFLPVP